MNPIWRILSSVIGGVADEFEGRRRLKQTRLEAQIAQAARAQEAESEWDNTMAQGSMMSWKDEYWTLIFGFPLILGAFPFWRDEARAYVEFIESMPDWYVGVIGSLVAASIGWRAVGRRLLNRNQGQSPNVPPPSGQS